MTGDYEVAVEEGATLYVWVPEFLVKEIIQYKGGQPNG